MKNNKGYTLVELLVSMVVLMMVLTEVYIVMNNGSNVYNKGSYDVSLQTKAQQALMHLENIIIDANESISYNGAGPNADLIITNDPGNDYRISYDNSDPIGQLYGYGKLMLTVTDDAGNTTTSPLVDNVTSYSVVTDEIVNGDGDSVFVNLTMANKEYTYSADTKEIYLRNRLGTRGSADADDDTTPSANFTLNVLRHKDYPLNGNRYYFVLNGTDALGNPTITKKYCNYFVWQSADGLSDLGTHQNDPNNKYQLVGQTTVKCNAGMDQKSGWDESATAVIRGYEDATAYANNPDKFITITIVTDKVGVGTTDYEKSAGYVNFCSGTSESNSCLTKIYGISVEDADKVDYTLYSCGESENVKADSSPGVVLKTEKGTGDDIRFLDVSKSNSTNTDIVDLSGGSITSDNVIFGEAIIDTDTLIVPHNVNTSDNYSQIKSPVYVYLDGDNNGFASFSKTHQTDNKFDRFKDKNEKFYLNCKIYYSGSGEYLEFPAFFLYTGEVDSGEMNKLLYKWANLEGK